MLPNVLSHYRTTGKAADTNGKKERTKDKNGHAPSPWCCLSCGWGTSRWLSCAAGFLWPIGNGVFPAWEPLTPRQRVQNDTYPPPSVSPYLEMCTRSCHIYITVIIFSLRVWNESHSVIMEAFLLKPFPLKTIFLEVLIIYTFHN